MGRISFEWSLHLRRDPTAVKASLLRDDPFTVDPAAIHTSRIQGKPTSEVPEALTRRVVRPNAAQQLTTAAADIEEREQALEGTVIRVLNKIDLSSRPPGMVGVETDDNHLPQESGVASPVVAISATTGEGIDILEDTILEQLGVSHAAGLTPFSARERHVRCLQGAAEALQIGIEKFEHNQAGELLAEDLRSAHNQLGEITGKFGADDLLGEIFSSFCIGK